MALSIKSFLIAIYMDIILLRISTSSTLVNNLSKTESLTPILSNIVTHALNKESISIKIDMKI